MDKKVDIKLMKHQMNFFNSNKKYTALVSGIGGGKTYAGSIWALSNAIKYPKCRGLITANTYKQLHKATLACFFQILADSEIYYQYSSQAGMIQISNTCIDCFSVENYDNIRGAEYGWAWLDEASYYRKEAFSVIIGRVRDFKGPRQLKITTTPNGYNWLHEFFVSKNDNTKDIIYASSKENKYLPDDYVMTLEQQYDSKLIKQEIQGQFINITSGQVYYSFDRNKNVKEFETPKTLKKVGCDFNVNPITAVLCYYENGRIFVYDEIYKHDSNTYELSNEIISKWGKDIDVFPDSTGKARKTSAVASDHEILRKAGLNVQNTFNPHVKDRYNCLNGLFERDKIIVHPNCKMLIKDLEQLTYENKDPFLSHISDALGYLVWALEPLRRPSKMFVSYYS